MLANFNYPNDVNGHALITPAVCGKPWTTGKVLKQCEHRTALHQCPSCREKLSKLYPNVSPLPTVSFLRAHFVYESEIPTYSCLCVNPCGYNLPPANHVIQLDSTKNTGTSPFGAPMETILHYFSDGDLWSFGEHNIKFFSSQRAAAEFDTGDVLSIEVCWQLPHNEKEKEILDLITTPVTVSNSEPDHMYIRLYKNGELVHSPIKCPSIGRQNTFYLSAFLSSSDTRIKLLGGEVSGQEDDPSWKDDIRSYLKKNPPRQPVVGDIAFPSMPRKHSC